MDIIPESVEDANENAKLNGSPMLRMRLVVPKILFRNGWQLFIRCPHRPPRTGLDDKLETIIHAKPERFVYISM